MDIDRLLIDLNALQLRRLIHWHWVGKWKMTRATVKKWRKLHGLPALD